MDILHVDGNVDDALLLQAAMSRSGGRGHIHSVHSAEDAIRYLRGEAPFQDRRLHPLPQLILTAIHLPNMTGFDFLTWLGNSEFANLPSVVLTSICEEATIDRALELGAAVVLQKPLGFDDLKAVARRLCEMDRQELLRAG